MTLSSMTHLQWMCRRGMLELDFLLKRFLSTGYSDLSDADKHLFEAMLVEADPVLFSWLMGHEACDPIYQSLVEKIRSAKAI